MEQEQEAKPKKSVGRPKKELSEAQKEALERGRIARAEKARKDREDKERLREQEKEVDRVILQRASKGQELRQKMAELKKQMEELEQSEPGTGIPDAPPAVAQPSEPSAPAPSAVAPSPGTVKEVPDDVQEPDQEEPEKEEIKVVRRIAGKGKGKKVIMIDASIFEDDDEPVQVKRVGGGRPRRPQPLRESRYKADRRTRFADDDIEEEEEEQEEYEEEYDDRRPVRRPVRRQDDYYREQMRDMNTMNDTPHHHSNMAPPLAPLVKQVYTHQQLREENPLYSMIFGK